MLLWQVQVIALAGTLLTSVFAAAGARSEGRIIGLVDYKALVTIDPATKKVMSQHTIRGVDARIVGFDVRLSDGKLYGIASNGEIYTFDLQSGQSKKKSHLSAPWQSGITTTIDFSPTNDRLRVMGSNGVNASVNVDDGKVTLEEPHKYKEGDVNAGRIPKIIAGAYSQKSKGTQTTALYAIDATTNSLLIQEPPNEGLLSTVGPLGISLSEPVAFNITTAGDGSKAMLTTGGVLYAVDLDNGKAAPVGKIEGLSGKLIDIQWLE